VLEEEAEKIIATFAENNINLVFNDEEKLVLLDKYKIYFNSKSSVIQTLEEVFINMAYYFYTDNVSPFIIDAGSEVGIATIFFKIFYPKAKILCF
jgi:hypothetical protein